MRLIRERPIEINTADGVPISFPPAGLRRRGAAFLIDLVLMGLLMLGVLVAHQYLPQLGDTPLGDTPLGTGALLIGLFAIRIGYFPFFETRGGLSPGKRLLGLRVIDRYGRSLDPVAVLGRNLMRELEITIPMIVAFSSLFLGQRVDLGLLWLFVLPLVMLIDPERRRLGDLLAGTVVVRSPKTALPDDLALADGLDMTFTADQLDIYGIKELDRMADVLRASGRKAERHQADAARRIAAKIGYTETLDDPRAFLVSYYRALRAQLERNLLFGKRRLSKADRL